MCFVKFDLFTEGLIGCDFTFNMSTMFICTLIGLHVFKLKIALANTVFSQIRAAMQKNAQYTHTLFSISAIISLYLPRPK